MKNVFLSLSIALATVLHAEVESTKALQFFTLTDDITLPDYVPPKAYYDSTDLSGKELRATTNVASATWSMLSGLLERIILPQSYTVYGADTMTHKIDFYEVESIEEYFQVCKKNHLWTLRGNLEKFSNPTNRIINTTRINPYNLDLVQKTLQEFTDKYFFYDDNTLSSRYLQGTYSMFPDFDWTTNSLFYVRSNEKWAETLLTLHSCQPDSLWKINDDTGNNALKEVCRFFEQFEWDWHEQWYTDPISANEWKFCNQSSICNLREQILNPVFDTKAENFTNKTLRLHSTTLGTLQHSIGALDVSYILGVIASPPYLNECLSHNRIRSSYTSPKNVTIEISSKEPLVATVPEFSSSWAREEIVETRTNNSYYTSTPLFACTGDTPMSGGTISLDSPPLVLTWEKLKESCDYFQKQGDKTFSIMLKPQSITVKNGRIFASLGVSYYYHPIEVSTDATFDMKATAVAQRSTTILRTLSQIDTNILWGVATPCRLAYQNSLISNLDLQAHENRYCLSGCHVRLDPYTYDWNLSTGRVTHASQRSVNVISSKNLSDIHRAWENEAYRFNAAVEALTPYPLRPATTLLHLNLAHLQEVEQEISKGGNIPLTWQSPGAEYCRVLSWDDESIQLAFLDDLGYPIEETYRNLKAGDSINIGNIGGSINIEAKTSMTPRIPFVATGDRQSFGRIWWQFNSIHTTNPKEDQP